MPSPIELMVDRACGVVPGYKPLRDVRAEEKALAEVLVRVADCAVAWRKDGTKVVELQDAIDALVAVGWRN